MQTRFSTRALMALLAVLALAAFRAAPVGTRSAHRASAVPEAEKAIPVEALEVSFPLDREGDPAVSRSEPSTLLSWPAPGAITSPFGGARHHPGIDIDGVTGDPVTAAAPGTVLLAGGAPAGYSGYGNVVMIDHGNGIATLYAHLSRVDVAMGQAVEQGQLIGAIGATGLAFGDHLHFEVREAGKPVDPMLWLPARA
ncbi:MAG: peptidase [Acidimicrobiales bacterium]|nr:peptidase [Acidimicrobiales bacterium]